MATRIVMEALSPTMEEGRLVEWKKKEGDPVAVGDVIAEVETDKAVMELVARAGGVLLRQLVPAGATVPVSQPVGWIGAAGESVDGGGGGGGGETASTVNIQRSTGTAPQAATAAQAAPVAATAPSPSVLPSFRPSVRVKASPLARKIAAERGVDLTVVRGSGPEGRVIRRDLEEAGKAEGRSGGQVVPVPSFRPSVLPSYTDVPLTQIRKTIAKRLVQSIGPIPTF